MYLYSNPDQDVQHPKKSSGAYEWWYFDLYDASLDLGLVLIFYDGLLFSPSYHRAQESSENALASAFPGLSFSLYHGKRTLFYALNEYPTSQVRFELLDAPLVIGSNRIEHTLNEHTLNEHHRTYSIELDESIPNGCQLKGQLYFRSDPYPLSFTSQGDPNDVHHWNLVQPKAKVSGEIKLWDGKQEHVFTIQASGYHDHNIGFEPLEKQFDEWYWGRIHLEEETLIWYLLREHHNVTSQAWLIPDHPARQVESVQISPIGNPRTSLFGLRVHPGYRITTPDRDFLVEQDYLWDNGPFYQRFRLKASVEKGASAMKNSTHYGIGEYMYPSRIQSKWTRPLINTRYFQKNREADWVKRSPFFSRLTW